MFIYDISALKRMEIDVTYILVNILSTKRKARIDL